MARGPPRRKDPDDFRCQGSNLGRRREKVGAGSPGAGNWGWVRRMPSDESGRRRKG